MSAFDLLARQHPALVHFPIAASLLLPLPLALRLWRKDAGWDRTILLLAWVGVLGGLAAQATGLLLARSAELIPPTAWFPTHPGLIRTHQVLAMSGFGAGLATLLLVHRGRSAWLRAATLICALLWAGLWGAAGHAGGAMVFPEEPRTESTP
jgi:hypothetical protein